MSERSPDISAGRETTNRGRRLRTNDDPCADSCQQSTVITGIPAGSLVVGPISVVVDMRCCVAVATIDHLRRVDALVSARSGGSRQSAESSVLNEGSPQWLVERVAILGPPEPEPGQSSMTCCVGGPKSSGGPIGRDFRALRSLSVAGIDR